MIMDLKQMFHTLQFMAHARPALPSKSERSTS
jgi:hypothetical protein